MTAGPSVAGRRERFGGRALVPRLMVLPAVAIVLVTIAYPTLWSLYMSFHAWFPASGTSPRWVGLSNYEAVLTSGRFWNSMENLAIYLVSGVGLQIALGTVLGIALYEFVKRAWVRTVLLTTLVLPMVIAPAVVGDMWKFIFTPAGVANHLLDTVGLPAQNWTSAGLGIWSVIIADIWQWTALPLLIVFAGRSALPNSIYEAARLDGSTWWFRTRTITLPLLRDLILIAVLLRVMDVYRLIDLAFIITNEGGPGTSNELPGIYAYLVAFRDFNVGHAATITWLIGIIALVGLRILWTVFRRRV